MTTCGLRVYGLLNVRIRPDHTLVQLGVFTDLPKVSRHVMTRSIYTNPYHDFRIECRSNKDGINATGYRSDEDLANLQSDEESKSYDDRGEFSVRVVCWVGEDEVEVSEKCARICDKGRAHG